LISPIGRPQTVSEKKASIYQSTAQHYFGSFGRPGSVSFSQ
jgi:hypothetical protein